MSARSGFVHARRRHASYAAFIVHRLSGIALTAFLPLHFVALALAIEGEARLDGFLAWADNPWVKLTETALVALLAAHLAGGLRLLALEWLAVSGRGKTGIAVVFGVATAGAALFALNAV